MATEQEANSGEQPTQEETPDEFITFKEFLEEYPIGTRQKVNGYYTEDRQTSVPDYCLPKATPILSLNCEECGGIRLFDGKWTNHKYLTGDTPPEDFLVYTCRNCHIFNKRFCLISFPAKEGIAEVVKVGEIPELHIKLPSNLRKLFGDDFSYFIKGLKCEKQGLGVGAYSYYRRLVENQKDRLLGEILKVSIKLSAKPEMIETLEAAIKETRFTQALDMAKESIPESLLVGGHNPFQLLHASLSIGIHEQPDDACMEIAHNIRMVLIDLAERIKLALGEKAELDKAVSSLMKFNNPQQQKK